MDDLQVDGDGGEALDGTRDSDRAAALGTYDREDA
jgi:hypothetical protein